MNKNFVATASTVINAPASKVWEALTKPELIKQYLFGADVVTDWKVGSPIVYKGMWEGKPFEDKGKILQVEPEKLLVSTHWSPLAGVPDTAENYHEVRYELGADKSGTRLTIVQDNNASKEEQEHSEQNWGMMLASLKTLLEK